MTTLSAQAAIDLLLSDPAKYSTSETLRNLAAQVATESPGRVTERQRAAYPSAALALVAERLPGMGGLTDAKKGHLAPVNDIWWQVA